MEVHIFELQKARNYSDSFWIKSMQVSTSLLFSSCNPMALLSPSSVSDYIKPSILPLGDYIAGVHHLNLLHKTFNKNEHGLREKDINHQNYDAVLRMTGKSMFC